MKRLLYRLHLVAGMLLLASLIAQAQPAEIRMPAGIASEPGQKSVQIAESVQFYDHGGKDGPFAQWQMARITFVPRAGERIKIQFTSCALSTAKVHLFHGLKSLESDMDEYDPTYSVPSGAAKVLTGTEVVTLISEKADGKLTVCFESGLGVTGDGWVATVSSEPLAGPSPAPQPTLFPKLAIYTVGATPIDFYDDGGLANPISKDFDGQVVFKPTTPGAKLQVEFKKVQLFYNSSAVSVGREDKLFVYQGEKPLAANKLGQITETPQTFRSVSDDGSLTITLKSVTAYPKAGFEAVVSEYVQSPMTFAGGDVEPASTETVAAGDAGQKLLWLNVRTTQNADPLALQSLTLRLGSSTPQAITKATLYYHPNGKDEEQPGVKVGDVQVTAGTEHTVQLAAPQPLAEGANYFSLAVDINETMPNGATVDARIASLTLSSGQKILETAQQPSVARTVSNLHRSVRGPVVRKVYTPWQFTHSPSKYNYDNYLEVEEDQVTTFKPSAPNSAVEIVFADFDVRYSSYHGVQAKFIIYDGPSASGTKLWEVNADNCKKGPQRPIHSTHPSGALTILFNANATLSYSCGKGWHATVTTFERKPMEVKQVAMLDVAPSALAPGGTRRLLMGFNLETQYPQSPLSLQEIALALQGNDLLAKLEVFASGSSHEMQSLGSATPIATLDHPEANAVITIPAAVLQMGANHFWISADAKPTAADGATLQFTLNAVKVSGTSHTPTGSSTGSLLLRNEYLMQPGDHTRELQPGEILHFYDDGGPNGVFSKNFKGSVVFIPPAGKSVRMRIEELHVAGPAPFRIYNGDYQDMAHNLLYHKLFDMPAQLDYVSTDPSGKLKVIFSSTDHVYPDWSGWHIVVSTEEIAPLSAGDIRVTNVAPASLLPGADPAPMLRIAVLVNGALGSLQMGDMVFSIAGTTAGAVASAKLMYSGLSDLPSGQEADAVLPAEGETTLTARHNVTIRTPGTHYFWLACAAQPTAAAGAKLAVRLTDLKTADGQSLQANLKQNDPAETTIQAPPVGMSGTYTIGASAGMAYPNFTKAIADLVTKGVSGPVEFLVEQGVYDEVLGLPHVAGASPTSTIRFRPMHPGETVEVSNSNWKHIGTPGVHTDRHGVVTLRGADHVTFEGITFRTDDLRYYSLVSLLHRSTNITFSGCQFVAPVSDGQHGRDIRHIALADTAVAGLQTNDHLHVKACSFTGGYIGIALSGPSSEHTRERGARITGNTFTNVGGMAIYAFQQEDLVVEGNTIVTEATQAIEAIGFAAAGLYGPTHITRNRIRLSTAKENRGIELRTPNIGTGDAPILVSNNEIHITSSFNSTNTFGILLGTGSNAKLSQQVQVLHNSVLIDGADCKNCGAVKLYGTAQDTQIDQNLLQVRNAKGKVYAAYMIDPIGKGFSFSRNGAWSADRLGVVAGTPYDAAKWKEKIEPDMVNQEADFVDVAADLSLQDGTPFQVGASHPLVKVDITAKPRPAASTTLGAREYQLPPLAFADGYPRIEAKDKTSITFAAAVRTEGVTLYYKLLLAGQDAPAEDAIDQQITVGKAKATRTISGLASGTSYILYLYLKDANGRKTPVQALPAVKTDLEAGVPLHFGDGTPTLAKAYSDAAVFQFKLTAAATVHYAAKRKGEPAPAWQEFDPQHAISIAGTELEQHPVQQLEANTDYILYAYAESADGQTTVTQAVPFRTDHATTFKPSLFNEKELGSSSPFDLGSQHFTGFSVVTATFPGHYGQAHSAKVNQAAGSITVNTTRYLGETISGLYVRYDKPFTMRLLDRAGKQTEENVPLTDCEWLYVPLAKYGPVLSIELTPGAGGSLELYSVGDAQHMGPEIYIDAPTPVALNAPTTLRARLNGCAWPYTVQWSTSDGATTLGNQLQQPITPTQAKQTYKLTVRDALGQNSATVDLRAGEALQVATFEDLNLPAGSTWHGDRHAALVQFASGSFALPNFSHPSDGWGGFAYSSDASTEWDGNTANDGRSAAGKGANGSTTWGVYYTSSQRQGTRSLALQVAPSGATLPGVWVTNTAYAFAAMSKGNAISGDKFGNGDYLKVTFRANGKQVDYYLADYRNPEATEHYILDQWAWVDLSPLGLVTSVEVDMEGSRANAHGQTLPLYLCLDDIGSPRPEKTVDPVQVFSSGTEPLRLPLATLAGLEPDALHAETEGDWTWPNGTQVALDGTHLTVAPWNGDTEATREFVVKLTRRGVVQWLRIPVALRAAVPTYTFGGYTITEGQGTVTFTVAGSTLQKGQSVQPTDGIKVEATPAKGWQLPATGAITANSATPVEGGLWRAAADGFTFSIRFEPIPPTTYTLLSLDWTGSGQVQLRNAANEELAQGATLTEGEWLTLILTPANGHRVDDGSLKTQGLEQAPDGKWRVVGNVNVSVAFVQETPAAEHTILLLATEGQGTLTLKRADGTPLKVNDKVNAGDLLTLLTEAAKGHELKALRTEGLQDKGNGQWMVETDVKVTAEFAKTGGKLPDDITDVPSTTLAAVRVYPNPVAQTLRVDNAQPGTRYALYDAQGAPRQRGQLTGQGDALQVGHLPAGIYLLHLAQPDGSAKALRVVKR